VLSGVQAAGVLAEPEDAEPAQDGREDGEKEQDNSDVVGVHGSNYWSGDIAPPVAGMTLLIDILPNL